MFGWHFLFLKTNILLTLHHNNVFVNLLPSHPAVPYNGIMSARFATDSEITAWNDHISANPDGGNILQGHEFIEQKVQAGWTARYLFIGDRAVSVIEKSVPLLGKVWYCPKGPSTTSVSDRCRFARTCRCARCVYGED